MFLLSHVRRFPAEHSGHQRDVRHSALDSAPGPVRQLPHHLHQPGKHPEVLIRLAGFG